MTLGQKITRALKTTKLVWPRNMLELGWTLEFLLCIWVLCDPVPRKPSEPQLLLHPVWNETVVFVKVLCIFFNLISKWWKKQACMVSDIQECLFIQWKAFVCVLRRVKFKLNTRAIVMWFKLCFKHIMLKLLLFSWRYSGSKTHSYSRRVKESLSQAGHEVSSR